MKKFKEIKSKIDTEKFYKALSSQGFIDIFDVIKKITNVDISDPGEHLITRDGLYDFFRRVHKDIKCENLLALEYSDSAFNFELIYGLGWFLISIIIGGVFAYIEWKILSYAFIIFGIMSLFAIKER